MGDAIAQTADREASMPGATQQRTAWQGGSPRVWTARGGRGSARRQTIADVGIVGYLSTLSSKEPMMVSATDREQETLIDVSDGPDVQGDKRQSALQERPAQPSRAHWPPMGECR